MGWQLHPGVEAAHIFGAMVLKLSCSSDDLAWLTPFLMHNRFLAFFYLLAMEMVVGIAIGLATAGSALLDEFTEEEAYWDTDRILGLLSSICLSIFALLLFIEYYFEEDDDDSDEDGSQEPIEVGEITKRAPDYLIATSGIASWDVEDVVKWWKTALPAMAQEQLTFIEDCEIHGKDLLRMDEEMLMEVGMKKLLAKKVMNEIDKLVDEDPRAGYTPHWPPNESNADNPLDDPLLSQQQSEKAGKSSKFTPLRVISVSLLGSFDDMAIQASVLKGGDLYWYQLVIGIALGASCVVGICLFLTSFESIRNCLEKLPVFLIIACFAAYSFVCTFI